MTVTHLRWGSDALSLLISHTPAEPVRLLAAGKAMSLPDPLSEPELSGRLARRTLPLVEVQTAGGWAPRAIGTWTAPRGLCATSATKRIRTALFGVCKRAGVLVLGSQAYVENAGAEPVTLEFVSSFAVSNLARQLPDGERWEDGLSLWKAANPWSGEFRWARATLA